MTALSISLAVTSPICLANDTLTLDDLAKINTVSATKISPNGEQIAFTRSVPRTLYKDKDGLNYTQLFVVDDKKVERPFITGPVNVSNLNYSADGQFIYFLAKMSKDKHKSLYRIPVDGGQAQSVMRLKNTAISDYSLNPENSKVALLHCQLKLKRK